ncbi:MAG: hypothetical protein JJU32_08470 [Phormidium sp. BM_Day4_Bin.17]|nr:hypothetical protein [Phormidium sp. BM_Day4_Bin.17]UCJ11795.1 MAG: hypothetical protein JWS08_18995 [Phormidium sp. PBR-2020]
MTRSVDLDERSFRRFLDQKSLKDLPDKDKEELQHQLKAHSIELFQDWP